MIFGSEVATAVLRIMADWTRPFQQYDGSLYPTSAGRSVKVKQRLLICTSAVFGLAVSGGSLRRVTLAPLVTIENKAIYQNLCKQQTVELSTEDLPRLKTETENLQWQDHSSLGQIHGNYTVWPTCRQISQWWSPLSRQAKGHIQNVQWFSSGQSSCWYAAA